MEIKSRLLKQGIVVIDYGEDCEYVGRKQTQLLREQVKAEIIDLFPHIEKLPLLILVPHMKGMSNRAIEYIHGDEVSSIINCSSYLSEKRKDSIIKRTLIRLYMWHTRPPYPFKISTSWEEAIEWLEKSVPKTFTHKDYERYLESQQSAKAS